MLKKLHCIKCGFNFGKRFSDTFLKTVLLECPNCGSHKVVESSRVNALVNKKKK